jgi:hypothetical protein
LKDLNFPRKWNWLGSRPTRAADIPTWQAIIFGVLIAYTPAAVFIAFILWREGDFSSSPPRRYKPEILTSDRVPYTRLASEIRNAAEHVNDTPLINQTELAQRIQFLNSRKFALVQVGFDIGPLPWAGRVIEDDDNGSEAPPIAP